MLIVAHFQGCPEISELTQVCQFFPMDVDVDGDGDVYVPWLILVRTCVCVSATVCLFEA